MEMTREKTQGLATDLIDRGKMSQSDAKKVADKLGEIAEAQINASVERILRAKARLGLIMQEALEVLQALVHLIRRRRYEHRVAGPRATDPDLTAAKLSSALQRFCPGRASSSCSETRAPEKGRAVWPDGSTNLRLRV